ncbi:MAG TPA: hypothetical protein VFM93_12580 [Candidatus Limnocylindria bacterium]|nr:hypothetical protein [Candidatus Limnocylindria bacterium]
MADHEPRAEPSRNEDFTVYLLLAAPIFLVTVVIIVLVVTIGVR